MNVMPLLTTWAEMADHDPAGFLAYFRTEWGVNGPSIAKDSSEMSKLRDIKVLCEDGGRRAFSEIYLPVPKLVFICKRYMLDHEKFGFVQLGKPLNREDGLGPWGFLESQLGSRTKDDVNFYLHLLRCIRQRNTQRKVEFPRRVMELYLRLHAVCEASPNTAKARQLVRDSFEKHELSLLDSSWTRPSNCLLHHLNYWLLKPAVLPTPESWESTEVECGVLNQFYQETLEISPAYSWVDVLASLEKAQGSTATFWYPHLRKFYRALDELLPTLSDEDKEKLRSFFSNKSYIGVVHNGSLLWYHMSSCVWAPELIVPTKIDLSDHYRGLKSFFTGFLKIPKYDCGLIYNDLLDLDPRDTSVDEAKEMLWSLNESLTECGHLLNHRSLLSRPIFPVRHRNGEVRLSPATSGFLIGDKQPLRQQFLDRVELLDFPAEDVWGLEPLILWAELEDRHLSCNIEEKTYLEEDAAPEPITRSFTAAQARGLLRIAKHFRSPRVKTSAQRQNFIFKIGHAKFFKTSGIYRQLSLNKGRYAAVADKQSSDLHISDLGDLLYIYISNREGAYEFCFMSTLPRNLVEWMMADPSAKEPGRSATAAVSAVKSILNVSDALIDDVLAEEGIIGDVESDLFLQPDDPQPTEDERADLETSCKQGLQYQFKIKEIGVSASEKLAEEETEGNDELQSRHELGDESIDQGTVEERTSDNPPRLQLKLAGSDTSTNTEPVEDARSGEIKEESQLELELSVVPTDDELVEDVKPCEIKKNLERELDSNDLSTDDGLVEDEIKAKSESELDSSDESIDGEPVEDVVSDEITEMSQPKLDSCDTSTDDDLVGDVTSDEIKAEPELELGPSDQSNGDEPVENTTPVETKAKSPLELQAVDTPTNYELTKERTTTDDKPELQSDIKASDEINQYIPAEQAIGSEQQFERFIPSPTKRMTSSIPRRISTTSIRHLPFSGTFKGEDGAIGDEEPARRIRPRAMSEVRISFSDLPLSGAKRKEPWKVVGSKNCIP